jgi:hypothetical protein
MGTVIEIEKPKAYLQRQRELAFQSGQSAKSYKLLSH